MEWLLIIIVYGVFLYAIFKLAKSKNREPGGWILASVIISPFLMLIILALMKTLPGKKKASIKRKKTSKKIK
tara:strand:- start:178 stop:393 length:216 start_codon:yes stop_codon:yes gene_type:complete